MTAQGAQNQIKEMLGFTYEDKKITVGTLKRYEMDMMDAKLTIFDIHDLVQGFNAKHGTSVRMIRPQVADFLLVRARSYPEILRFTFPTDVAIAYEKPGNALGEEIIYTTRHTLTYPIIFGPKVILQTGKFKGSKDIALVVPDLTADDMKRDGKDIRIEVPDSRIVAVPDFPDKNGFYKPDSETAVPHGERISHPSNYNYRDLFRKDGPYVGPISRNGDIYEDYCRKEVYASGFSIGGVVVEIPEKDLEKIPGTATMLKL